MKVTLGEKVNRLVVSLTIQLADIVSKVCTFCPQQHVNTTAKSTSEWRPKVDEATGSSASARRWQKADPLSVQEETNQTETTAGGENGVPSSPALSAACSAWAEIMVHSKRRASFLPLLFMAISGCTVSNRPSNLFFLIGPQKTFLFIISHVAFNK